MFLRNAWYIAMWAKDLGEKPVAKTLLNDKVAFYRKSNGDIAAIEDRCCHRAAPLSMGWVENDLLVCGYHGLTFNEQGACVKIPGQDRIPRSARVRSYPVVQRWNAVWIWMGDPEAADPTEIPELYWLDSPEWASTPGYIHLKSNYQLLIDNLLDLTHVSYVQKNTIAGDPREAVTPVRIERSERGVKAGRWMIDFVPPPLFARVGNFKGNVDRWQWVTWTAPSIVFLDVGAAETGTGAPEGDRSKGISIWANHLVTPETETTTHYNFAFSRNFALNDPEMADLLYQGSLTTFMEDAAVLEGVQGNLRGGNLEDVVDIVNDGAQLQCRKILAKLIEEENVAAAEPAPAPALQTG
jgi:phenylpropionate dioxygenase-like ring-hydroxylating dioxygenase large terminal subunit